MKPDEFQAIENKLRKKRKWNTRRLAEELGVHVSTISRWRRGVVAIDPSAAKLLRRIAEDRGVAA